MNSEDLTRWIACDKCNSAHAMYFVKLVTGELFFCGHHLNEYKEALDKVSYEIIELNKVEESPRPLETERI
jgi:hypothetical protein